MTITTKIQLNEHNEANDESNASKRPPHWAHRIEIKRIKSKIKVDKEQKEQYTTAQTNGKMW